MAISIKDHTDSMPNVSCENNASLAVNGAYWPPALGTVGGILSIASFPFGDPIATSAAAILTIGGFAYGHQQLRKHVKAISQENDELKNALRDSRVDLGITSERLEKFLKDIEGPFILPGDFERIVNCADINIHKLVHLLKRKPIQDHELRRKMIKLCASLQIYLITQAVSKRIGSQCSCCIKVVDDDGIITPSNTVRDIHSTFIRKVDYGKYHFERHSLFVQVLEEPKGRRYGFINDLNAAEERGEYVNPNQKRRNLYNATSVNLIGDDLLQSNSPKAFLCLDAKIGQFDESIARTMRSLGAAMFPFVQAYVES